MSRLQKIDAHVLVCIHKTCLQQGGKRSADELKRALKERNLRDRVMITKVDCLDQCGRGPVMVVYPDGVWYGDVDAASAREIVEQHMHKGRTVARKVLCDLRDPAKKRK